MINVPYKSLMLGVCQVYCHPSMFHHIYGVILSYYLDYLSILRQVAGIFWITTPNLAECKEISKQNELLEHDHIQ